MTDYPPCSTAAEISHLAQFPTSILSMGMRPGSFIERLTLLLPNGFDTPIPAAETVVRMSQKETSFRGL
jgi:hypothetical protein